MIDKNIINKIKSGTKVLVRERKEKGENIFQGLIISKKHGKETGATFTVRAIIDGVGVEKIYPIYSPLIKVKILKEHKTKRAKLYWVRNKSEAEIRKKLKSR